jgi:hypothetical protein
MSDYLLNVPVAHFLFLCETDHDMVALCALLLSFASLLFGIYQFRSQTKMQIKNTKDSVRPLLDIILAYSVNMPCGYYIVNQGLGPAIIFDIFYLHKGKEVKTEDIMRYLDGINMAFWKNRDAVDVTEFEDTPLRAGDTLWVLKTDSGNVTDAANRDNRWLTLTRELNLVVKYKSLTGESFTTVLTKKAIPDAYKHLLKNAEI